MILIKVNPLCRDMFLKDDLKKFFSMQRKYWLNDEMVKWLGCLICIKQKNNVTIHHKQSAVA